MVREEGRGDDRWLCPCDENKGHNTGVGWRANDTGFSPVQGVAVVPAIVLLMASPAHNGEERGGAPFSCPVSGHKLLVNNEPPGLGSGQEDKCRGCVGGVGGGVSKRCCGDT